MTPHIDEVKILYPDARPTEDGEIVLPNCPICLADGHPGKPFTIFPGGATSCVRGAAGGPDFNREHCHPVRVELGLNGAVKTSNGLICETLFEGALSLECDRTVSAKSVVIARNCNPDNELWRDKIDLDQGDARRKFASKIEGFNGQRDEIERGLLNLARRREASQTTSKGEDNENSTESVIFKELPDGRLIEQLAGQVFAIYDGESVEILPRVEADGITYLPVSGDPTVDDNDLHLPARVTEYGDEKQLDQEIENYLARFCDAAPRELKLAAKLVRLTYVQDRLNEVPYLHIVGPSGSGKTRMSDVTGMICYHPCMIVDGSASSIFRICDKYCVTACVDEFNPSVDSEDQQALIQIFNAGFQRRRKARRTEKGPNGEWVTRAYSPFGMKIFSGLKLTGSYAFNRRTIPIQLSVTKNKSIPFCDDGAIEELSEPIREKLALWRLRNWKKDWRSLIRETEALFKQREIAPGFVQIGVPLAMLIEDAALKDEFIGTMETRTGEAAEDRQQSFDGQIVGLIHKELFDVDDKGQATWKIENPPKLEEGQPCEALRVEFLVLSINDDLPQNKKIDPGKFGRILRGIGFQTKKIKSRESAFRDKTAVVYDPATFARIFNSFTLPVPGDFTSPTSPTSPNSPETNELAVGLVNSEKDQIIPTSPTSNSSTDIQLREVGLVGLVDSVESEGLDIEKVEDGLLAPISGLVALDTETEPFTKKWNNPKIWTKFKQEGKPIVTPRSAKMIGLALSYDGQDRTSYTTEPAAWPVLAPESNQTVIFHHAKFDLLKLEQAGLPTPDAWEDTMIAAHLIQETGKHGLKDLAKEHLGITDPKTFEEADRERVLNPEVFDEYAKNDTRYTFRLWSKFESELERQQLMEVYRLEKAVVPVVMSMEDAGMKLDLTQMDEMRQAVQVEADAIEAEIYDLAGHKFDLKSPRAVGVTLFDELGIESSKQTKGGKRSVDEEALKDIRGFHPVVDAILRYRKRDKLASSFLKTLPIFADERGRIHPEFKQLGATSGRFSCANPNVQQIPKRSDLGRKLRQMFIAEEGSALVVSDWSQMELRILAQYSKDPLLLEVYSEGAEARDLHKLTAARMFGRDEADVTKDERDIAKMINFGIAYGITPLGLFNRLRPSGVEVTQEQCERFIASWFDTYPGVEQFLSKVERQARREGFVRSLSGRRRRVSSRNAREVRQAQNFIIQGTAADVAKMAMVRLHSVLPPGARMVSVIHDEFIVECREGQADEVREMMVEVMQEPPAGFTVPMLVEAKIAGNWGDAK